MSEITPYNWSREFQNTISWTKRLMAYISVSVRRQQFQLFLKYLKPTLKTQVLDVGVTPDNQLIDSNYFEQVYPYPHNLSVASVEECPGIVSQFKLKEFFLLKPNQPYPFSNRSFEIVTSWATLEHVGSEQQQRDFLIELNRIGKKVFITTPYRYFPYEMHIELFFIHWLPRHWYQYLLKWLGKDFWATDQNWRPLGLDDIKKILPNNKFRYQLFWSFGWLPSHIIIYKR